MSAGTQYANKVRLKFDETLNDRSNKIRDDLSTVARSGKYLWLAFDEGSRVERLKKVRNYYAQHQRFYLGDYLDLPEEYGEMDIEGITYSGHYLWVVGSHSLKRDSPGDEDREASVSKQIKKFLKVKNDPNRHTIARIPLIEDSESGEFVLHKKYPHPDNPGELLTAAKLDADASSDQLSRALGEDKHLKTALTIPAKENGFDIEGIAVVGDRIFLGLRGPVLVGWAIILEIAVKQKGKKPLKLKKIGKHKQKYRKHFINLHGMGIRELDAFNDDLLILAGPTMNSDGTIALYRINGGLPDEKESITYHDQVERLVNVTLGHETEYGTEKAEGLVLTDDHRLMVVYDTPCEARKPGEDDTYADIFNYE